MQPAGLFLFSGMRPTYFLCFAAAVAAFACSSCALKDEERKPVGPVSNSSQIPWNTPVPGQGQGQFGMLPQNQYRR